MTIDLGATRRPPDFLCIGAQKAGTTWLQYNLRKHPLIWIPKIKEIQYFNQIHISGHESWTQKHRDDHVDAVFDGHAKSVAGGSDIDWRLVEELLLCRKKDVSDDWYLSLFGLAPPIRTVGEMTPEYSVLPIDGIKHILSLNERLKIILMVRDPIDRAWSHMRMLIARNPEPTRPAELGRMALLPDILGRSDYNDILARWLSCVDPGRLLILDYAHLATKADAVLQDAVEFLELTNIVDSSEAHKKVHAGPEKDMPEEVYELLKARLKTVYDNPHPAVKSILENCRVLHFD